MPESETRPLGEWAVSDDELVGLAFRWGGGTLPSQLRSETLRDLHTMWRACDARDEAERNAGGR